MSVGERIQEARKKAGMKQSELAEKLGVAAITIGQYERDKRQPRIEQLQAIAASLGVSVSFLMGYPTKTHWMDVVKITDETLGERIADAFTELNPDGQRKAVERVEELTEIPRYRRQEPQEPPPVPPEGKEDTTPPVDGSERPTGGSETPQEGE